MSSPCRVRGPQSHPVRSDPRPYALRRDGHDSASVDPWQLLTDYVAAGRHVDPDTGHCRPLVDICRDLQLGRACFDEAAVVRLTGATREELRGLPLSVSRPAHLRGLK